MTPLVERVDARALRRLERRRVDDVLSARHTPWMCGSDERPTPWSQNGSWFPWVAVPGCQLALRAELGYSLNGSTVSALADQTSNGRNATQSTAAKQPAFNASDAAYGGRSSMTFTNPSATVLKTVAFLVAQPFTVIVVGHSTIASQNGAFTDAINGGYGGCIYAGSGGSYPASLYSGAILSSTTSVHSPSVIAGVFNGASSQIFVNNSQTPVRTGNAGAANLNGVAVGGNNIDANPLSGTIAQLLVFSGALSSSSMAAIFRDAGQHYGLAGVS